MKNNSQPQYADDATEDVSLLLRLRLPWLVWGLVLGLLLTIAMSKFESILAAELRLAFFIPVIVYMSDAVGTQTQTIFVRNLAKGPVKLANYLVKELALGLILGGIFGLGIGLFALLWFNSSKVAATVGLAMSASVTTATILALLVANLLKAEHQDPAVGAGPVTTVIQDLISVLIYFGVASLIILG